MFRDHSAALDYFGRRWGEMSFDYQMLKEEDPNIVNSIA